MKRSPLRRRNNKRRKKLWEKQFGSEERLAWLKSRKCYCGKPSTDCHHVISRGAGGTKEDLVPLCRTCHNLIHQKGAQHYERFFGVNLREEAHRLSRQYREGVEGT